MTTLFNYECNDFDIMRCEEFTRNLGAGKAHWKSINNFSDTKLVRINIMGKLGEVAVSKYLQNLGFFAATPDFDIYAVRNKSYNPDIMLPGSTGIHIKTQNVDLGKKYGVSWIFNTKDPVINHPKHDLGIFCEFKDGNSRLNKKPVINIRCCVKMENLTGLYKPTVRLNNNWQCAIYYEDIKHIDNVDVVDYVNSYRMRA